MIQLKTITPPIIPELVQTSKCSTHMLPSAYIHLLRNQQPGNSVCAVRKVEDMRRKDLYRRDRLLQKIQGETAKARAVLTQRATLQEARKKVRLPAALLS
jgi:hypothetical protein